jgi:sphingolipid 4-desaturase/C4-monooxygenase
VVLGPEISPNFAFSTVEFLRVPLYKHNLPGKNKFTFLKKPNIKGSSLMAKLDYIRVQGPEPHRGRAQALLKAHPELMKLCGPTPSTSFFVFLVVGIQIALAYALKDQHWGWLLLAAWTVGAVANHALWVLIHDLTHNLVFRKAAPNCLLQIFANLPIVFPAAISFRTYHLQHHRYQGMPNRDADLAVDFEAKLVGNSTIGKALWLMNFWLFQSLRVRQLKEISFFGGWMALNVVVQIAFDIAIVHFMGWGALGYLFMASIFSVGFHPLGARWIQEHYVMQPGQETYSYYGPLNKVAFNVGFHNEHHDMMAVPWSRLPQVKKIAPEFYDSLYSHQSWTGLWLKFLFDKNLSLYSRAVRVDQKGPDVNWPKPKNWVEPATAKSSNSPETISMDPSRDPATA